MRNSGNFSSQKDESLNRGEAKSSSCPSAEAAALCSDAAWSPPLGQFPSLHLVIAFCSSAHGRKPLLSSKILLVFHTQGLRGSQPESWEGQHFQNHCLLHWQKDHHHQQQSNQTLLQLVSAPRKIQQKEPWHWHGIPTVKTQFLQGCNRDALLKFTAPGSVT